MCTRSSRRPFDHGDSLVAPPGAVGAGSGDASVGRQVRGPPPQLERGGGRPPARSGRALRGAAGRDPDRGPPARGTGNPAPSRAERRPALGRGEERWDRASRKRLLEAGFGAPHVAVTDRDVPCYVQWLFGHKDNEFLAEYFHGAFPVLAVDEALLEGAFTPAAFRGKRIMSAAMASIAERGADLGARWVLTFVGTGNTASLKGCARAGFSTYTGLLQEWWAFRCRTSFRPLDRLGGATGTSAAWQ